MWPPVCGVYPEQEYNNSADKTIDTKIEPASPIPLEKKKNMVPNAVELLLFQKRSQCPGLLNESTSRTTCCAGAAVKPVRHDAERIKPVLICCSAREPDLPADLLPSLAARSQPHDLCIHRLQPTKPAEGFIHSADCIRRGWAASNTKSH